MASSSAKRLDPDDPPMTHAERAEESERTTEPAPPEPDAARRHRFGGWFRDRRWFSRTPVDERPYFEATALFQARDMAQAEFLFDAMIDGLGCPQRDPDGSHVCPHFRFGGLHQLDDGETT